MADDIENYILLLLSDSNLPTGSFVASSGLESHIKHGFHSSNTSTIDFVQHSLTTYARSALPFASDAHVAVEFFSKDAEAQDAHVLAELLRTDDLYESMTLNHVARRASRAQGVALLTLYSKGFAPPSSNGSTPDPKQSRLLRLVDELKTRVRRDQTPGHLPVCWGVLTAALGLSLGAHLCFPASDHIFVLMSYSKITVSSSLPARAESAFRRRPPQHRRPVRRAADAPPFGTPSCHS